MLIDDLRHVLPFMIPLLALLIPIVAIVAHYLSKSNRERVRHETIRQIAQAGQTIPPELLSADADSDAPGRSAGWNAANPNRNLTPGVINLSAGLGLMGMFAVMRPGSWLWGIGLIPFCLGLGFLLLWSFERKQATPPGL